MCNHVTNFTGTHQVVVLEKLDGANCCINSDGEVFARTHSKVTSLPWFSTIKSMVRSFDIGVMKMLRNRNLVLFGESSLIVFFFTIIHIVSPCNENRRKYDRGPFHYLRRIAFVLLSVWCSKSTSRPVAVMVKSDTHCKTFRYSNRAARVWTEMFREFG